MQHRWILAASLATFLVAPSLPAHAGPITLLEPGFTEIPVAVFSSPGNNFGDVTDDGAGNVYATGRFNPNAVRITGGVVTPLGNLTGTPLSLHLSGSTLYVGNSAGQLFTYNTTLPVPPAASFGTVTGVGLGSAHSITQAPLSFGSFGGDLIVGGFHGIAAVDPITAGATLLSSLINQFITGVAFTNDGRLLATNINTGTILEVSSTGTISTFASLVPSPGAITVHPVTGDVYVAGELTGTILKYNSTGTSVSTFASGISWDGGHFPSMLSFSQDGSTLYFGEVPANNPSFGLRAITGFSSITAVPEPSSLALLALGGMGLVFSRRRRTRNAA